MADARFKTYDGGIDLIRTIFSLPMLLKSLYIFSDLSVLFRKASSEHFVSGIASLTSFLTNASDPSLPYSVLISCIVQIQLPQN